MKGVLIGSDLMYRQDGKIVPVEINTQTGWDTINRVEREEDVFDFSDLRDYINRHNITDVFLEGSIRRIMKYWPEDMGADVHSYEDADVESVENDNVLVIRSSYSDEAYVDNFCRDKINFLRAIEDRDYGCEFIWNDGEGLVGEITTLVDNGDLPNFIVKCRYPHYDRRAYPKFLRFETVEQLDDWVVDNLEEDFLIMPFYFNEEKGMWEDSRLKLIRNWTIWVEGEEGLDSLYLGKYTKLTAEISDEVLEWDEFGNPVDQAKVHDMFITNGWMKSQVGDLLIESDDVVLMEDNTWKTAEDLKVGDRVKAVTVPTDGTVDIHNNIGDYNISFERLQEESEFTVNEVQVKKAVEGWIDETVMYFTDGTDWFDSDYSSYPVLDPEDETVSFKLIRDITVGDRVILMPTGSAHLQIPEFVLKVVERVEKRRVLQKGYSISLNGNHLFLSKTSADAQAYISIEHNALDHNCASFKEIDIQNICSNTDNPELLDMCNLWNIASPGIDRGSLSCEIWYYGQALCSGHPDIEFCSYDPGTTKVRCWAGCDDTSCGKCENS